ncbi:O-antigen ligase family protein [Streptomyces sp. NBC_00704]|uniref:O-antigen ligase family protein n=1 Tax=Streptomyces sp. NBC_00704 TaxID=2975809 RepID=UPI002E2F0ED3|nr:O-antigen ligase family protein [Streptomyces sp. NBC_00704]
MGAAVLAACAVWSLVTAAVHDGRPEGVLLAVLALAAGYAAGRILGALTPVAAPCAGAAAGLVLAVLLPRLDPGPEAVAPLGHAGAAAALLILSAGAACCAAWTTPVAAVRLALWLLAGVVVVAGALLGSAAAVVACGAVLLCSSAAGGGFRRGPVLAGLTLVAALVTGLTWAVAGSALPGGLAGVVREVLTSRRVELWRDALGMARRASGLGVGPGRFGELSETAARSSPPDGKPHSAPLQLAAEQGVVGVLLLGAVFCWVLFALWRAPRPTPVVLTTGASLTALAVVASAGNALSFTTVTAGAGLLAGVATARPLAEALPVCEPARTSGAAPRCERDLHGGRPSA